jgi:hypothetical protein
MRGAEEILARAAGDGEVIPMTKIPLTRLTLLAAGLLAAGRVDAQRPATRVRAVLPAYNVPIAIDTIMQRTSLDAKPGAIWSAASKVFYDLKISTDIRDSAGGVIGVTKLNKSSFFANEPMSKLLSCGNDMTGPRADSHRISIVLVAIISPLSAEKTELGVGFIGSAIDMKGTSSNPVACAPTGRMEALFAEKVRKVLRPDAEIIRKPGE